MGVGRAGSPSVRLHPGSRPGRAQLRCHGGHQIGVFETGRSSSFSTLCPCRGRASPGDRVAGLWSLGLQRPPGVITGWEPVRRPNRAPTVPGLPCPGFFPRPCLLLPGDRAPWTQCARQRSVDPGRQRRTWSQKKARACELGKASIPKTTIGSCRACCGCGPGVGPRPRCPFAHVGHFSWKRAAASVASVKAGASLCL